VESVASPFLGRLVANGVALHRLARPGRARSTREPRRRLTSKPERPIIFGKPKALVDGPGFKKIQAI